MVRSTQTNTHPRDGERRGEARARGRYFANQRLANSRTHSLVTIRCCGAAQLPRRTQKPMPSVSRKELLREVHLRNKAVLGPCMSLGSTLRFPASSLGAGRKLKHPRSLLSHHRSAPFRHKSSRQKRQERQQPKSVAPVAITGAGPAGLTLSPLLSKCGIPSILLEKSPALPPTLSSSSTCAA